MHRSRTLIMMHQSKFSWQLQEILSSRDGILNEKNEDPHFRRMLLDWNARLALLTQTARTDGWQDSVPEGNNNFYGPLALMKLLQQGSPEEEYRWWGNQNILDKCNYDGSETFRFFIWRRL